MSVPHLLAGLAQCNGVVPPDLVVSFLAATDGERATVLDQIPEDKRYLVRQLIAALRSRHASTLQAEAALEIDPATNALLNLELQPEGPPAPGRLDDAFWQARPELANVALAADSMTLSREAQLLTALGNVALHIPVHFHLPGPPRNAAPTMFVAVVGQPGDGKGANIDLSTGLVALPDDIHRESIGSAENLSSAFYEPNPDKEDKAHQFRRHYHPVLIRIDEMATFTHTTRQRTRDSGDSGVLGELKRAWSGETLGFGYRSPDKRFPVDPLSYRLGLICGVAPAKAGPLFDDAGGGFPQRLLFAPGLPVSIPEDYHDLPRWDANAHRWRSPFTSEAWQVGRTEPFPFDDGVTAYIRFDHHEARKDRISGIAVDELDTHKALATKKVAVALAVFAGRVVVMFEDYMLAEQVVRMSIATRTWLLDLLGREDQRRTATRLRYKESEGAAVERGRQREAERTTRIVDKARDIARRVKANPGITRRELQQAARRYRDLFDDALDHALDQRWIDEKPEPGQGADRRAFHPGEVKP